MKHVQLKESCLAVVEFSLDYVGVRLLISDKKNWDGIVYYIPKIVANSEIFTICNIKSKTLSSNEV